MNSVVTQRFIKCHDKLKEDRIIRSSRQFAISLDYLPQSLSEVIRGRRDVTIELIRKAVERYKINPMYLYTGSGPMFMTNEDRKSFKVLTIVKNQQDEERIVHVPTQLQHHYVESVNNPSFIQNLPSFSLPDYKYQSGTFRCFDVHCDEMEPTLMASEKVVCSYIEPDLWERGIKSNYIYVVVSNGALFIRRVVNKLLEQENRIELHADNQKFEQVSLGLSEIKEIWMVKTKIGSFVPDQILSRITIMNELKELKQAVNQQSKIIHALQNILEQMAYEQED